MKLHINGPEKGLFSVLAPGKRLGSAVLTLFFLAVSFSSSFGQSPEVRKAFRLIDIEQPSKGLSALEQLANSNASNSSFQYYLGLAQLRTGALNKALASFEKGISINEKDGLNYAGKGHVRLLEKNPTDAKAQFDKALSVSRSKDANVLEAVAEAYLTDTKYLLDAISLLNKAKGINSTDFEVHMLLGDALIKQNTQQGGDAVSSYERAAKADPKSGKPHYKIGKIYQQARASDIALASFEKAIAIDPEYAPAYKELGQTAYKNKEAEKAVKNYEKYLAITETPGDAKYQYAFFLFLAKQYEKANAIFKEVTSNPNVSPLALRYYAYSLVEQAKTEGEGGPKTVEARRIFEQYFQKAKPEELEGADYAYFGDLLLKTGEDSLAIQNFELAFEMDSTQTQAGEAAAEAYFKAKKYDKAIESYSKLINSRKTPLMAEVFNLGRSYFYNLDFVRADSVFTLVAEKTPNMTVGYLWAAKARRQIDSTGVQGLANPMFESVIEKGSSNPEKYKKDLIEAYEYMGSYYVNIKPDIAKAKDYFQKILELDPAHAQAKEALKVINAPAPPNKGR
jgi:tetratricopeptide (TPR) repeat protein